MVEGGGQVLLALGSRGDVQPMASLARGLTSAGHEATVVALAEYASLVAELAPDAHVQPVAGSLDDAITRGPVTDVLSQSLAGQYVLLKRWTSRMASTFADAVLAATHPGDTIITGVLTRGVALALVDGLGCRMASVVYTGQVPTLHRESFFAPQYFSGFRPYDRWGAHLAWSLATSLGQALTREGVRRLDGPRRNNEWLSNRSRWLSHSLRRTGAARLTRLADEHPILVAASPLLVPAAPDWPSTVHQTGYWAPERGGTGGFDSLGERPLLDFLEREPVYVGFGSFTRFTRSGETAAIVRAAELTGRPLLTLTRPGQPAGFLSDKVFATTGVGFEWLFPRVAATIHHGGSGTSHEALRSGRPTAVVPFGADQPYHAQRLYALGLGPAPLPVRRLAGDSLAHLIDALTTSPQAPHFAERAREVAQRASRERGVATAVDTLARLDLLPHPSR